MKTYANKVTDNTVTPVVSVILPAYNGSKTIYYAIKSILLQNFNSFELLIIDDASTDNTVDIVGQFTDDRIRLICGKNNMGLSNRLNQVILEARGKYIARMDQDDISLPDRLRIQVEYLDKHKDIDLVASNAIIINNTGKQKGKLKVKTDHGDICKKPWNGFYLPHPTWMARIEWYRKYKYISSSDGVEDQFLLFRTYRNSKFYCIDIPLLAYCENRSIKKMLTARYRFAKNFIFESVANGRILLALIILISQVIKVFGDLLNNYLKISMARNKLEPILPAERKLLQEYWDTLHSSKNG